MKEIIEVSDRLKICQFMRDNGFVNPSTGNPFSFNGLQNYFLGIVNTKNKTIEAGIKAFYEDRKAKTENALKQLAHGSNN
jgi:hypothetical protein